MHACPNCSTPLRETDRFCARCGQKTHQHRFNLPHIFHEFFHAFTHADKGVLMLIRDLALRPGRVLREYIVEFKRARYFNPFTLLLLVLGFALFINSVVKPYTSRATLQTTGATFKIEQNGPATAQHSAAVARQRQVSEWIEKRYNWMHLASLPITSLVFWLFYRRLHYAEHLVAQIVLAGFYMLVSILLLLLALVPSLRQLAVNSGPLLLHAGYLTWAYGQFMGGGKPSGYVRSAVATVCALMLWIICSAGLIYLYIRFG